MAGRPSAWAVAADLIDPPPPPPEHTSAVALAERCSRGAYQRYRHVEIMDEAINETIATGGRLILAASVRHSKSQTASKWTPARYIGANPDKRVILAAHTADFAANWGRAARDILTEYGPEIFGVSVSRKSEAANRWDIANHDGGMLTVGVGGSPVGRGADLMIVDDPIKSYADAMSPLVRQRVKEWWTGTMAHRIEPDGAVILIMSRWHDDDLAGFLLREDGDQWRELRMPALCEDPAVDPLGRELGAPLWPERWPLKALEQRKREVSLALGEVVWLAQYQQRPQAAGGTTFPEDKWAFMRADEVPVETRWCRGYDLAATDGGGDWTVGARMGRMPDGRFVVADVLRGQWSGHVWRTKMRSTAEHDPDGTIIQLPQDPGQAGKDQAIQLVSHMAGFNAKANPVTGSKEIRAAGYAAQVQAGNVVLVEAAWNGAFVAEHTLFPRGTHDDQVDAAATAFNVLAPTGEPGVRWLNS